MNKRILLGMGIIFLGVLFVIIRIIILPSNENDKTNINTIDIDNPIVIEETEIEWTEITKEGVNEELLFENMNTEILEKVASNFQSVIEEEQKEEQEKPDIIITEGWTRIFNKEKYKEVISIGKPAMKPLYYILYKSKNNGQYEYLCAKALQEISGIGGEISKDGTMQWSTAKEYLDLFTKKVIN